MPRLKDLTKKEWSKIKKNAGIEKNKKFLKQDANVGKFVAKLEKARGNWKAAKSTKNLAAYVGALDNLDKAFTNFEKTKDLEKGEAASLKKDLGSWKQEIANKNKKLIMVHKNLPELLKLEDKKQINNILEDCGLSGI